MLVQDRVTLLSKVFYIHLNLKYFSDKNILIATNIKKSN